MDNKSIVRWKREAFKIKDALTREQIMKSEAFQELSQSAVDAMTYGLGKVRSVNIYRPDSDTTAWSIGGEICVNTGTQIVESEENHEQACLLVAGLRAHECGHELFTDFPTYQKMFDAFECDIDSIINQTNELCIFDAEDKKRGIAMCEDLKKYPYRKHYVMEMFHHIQNIYEDSFVNNGIFKFFAGEPSYALKALNKKAFDDKESYQTIIQEYLNKKMKMDILLYKVLHKEAIGYPYFETKMTEDENKVYSKVKDIMNELKAPRKELPYEGDSKKRVKHLLKVLIRIYEALDEEMSSKDKEDMSSEETAEKLSDLQEQSKKDEEMSSEDKEDMSSEEKEERLSDLQKQSKKESPSGSGGTPLMKVESTKKDGDSSADDDEANDGKEDGSHYKNIEKMMDSIAKEKAMENIEGEHAKQLAKEAESISEKLKEDIKTTADGVDDTAQERKKLKVDVFRLNKNEFLYYKDKVDKIIKKNSKAKYLLVRKLKTILKDREPEDMERRKYSGTKVFVKDASKPGMKVFARRNEPTGKPNVRVCVLVDESGSMSSNFSENTTRSDYAREKAILLHEVLKELGVAHAIVGHSAEESDWNSLQLRNYVDYDTFDNMDIYRLGEIRARYENRDGAAICQCCEKLLQYPENKKILIVISDGLPSHNGYMHNEPLADAILSVRKYSKKGIEIIGTNMCGYSKVKLREIYGSKYVDCTSEDKFSKTLIKLISNAVLN